MQGRLKDCERSAICCNPFNSHDRKKVDNRSLSLKQVEKLRAVGISWVTTRMKICSTCRKQLNNLHKSGGTFVAVEVNVENQTHVETLDNENISMDEDKVSSESQDVTSSENEESLSFERDMNIEINKSKEEIRLDTIKKLAGIFGIELPRLSDVSTNSKNFREKSSLNVYLQILQSVKELFPCESEREKNNFDQVYDKNFTQELFSQSVIIFR